MKKDLATYLAVLVLVVAIKYVIELQWGATLAFDARPLVPWIIDAAVYLILGGLTWMALWTRPISLRILLLALVAVVPHVMFEVTHGSDPAYPYIGLLFIAPDLVWVSIGAGAAAFITSRKAGSNTS